MVLQSRLSLDRAVARWRLHVQRGEIFRPWSVASKWALRIAEQRCLTQSTTFQGHQSELQSQVFRVHDELATAQSQAEELTRFLAEHNVLRKHFAMTDNRFANAEFQAEQLPQVLADNGALRDQLADVEDQFNMVEAQAEQLPHVLADRGALRDHLK